MNQLSRLRAHPDFPATTNSIISGTFFVACSSSEGGQECNARHVFSIHPVSIALLSLLTVLLFQSLKAIYVGNDWWSKSERENYFLEWNLHGKRKFPNWRNFFACSKYFDRLYQKFDITAILGLNVLKITSLLIWLAYVCSPEQQLSYIYLNKNIENEF